MTIPAAAVVVLLLGSLLVTVLVVAQYQTDVARSEQAKLADGAVKVRADHLEKTVLDYAAWDDAVARLVNRMDWAWADDNIGTAAYRNLGIDMSFVIAPDGTATYALVEGRTEERALSSILTGGFGEILNRQRLAGRTGSTSGLILADGLPAIVAIAPIRPSEPDLASREPQHLLVFVDTLDGPALADLARIYLLPGLHVELGRPASGSFVPLRAMDGSRIGALAWNGSRPGDALLRTAVPVWTVLTLGFGLLTALIFRQARSLDRLIVDSERRARQDVLTDLPNRVSLFERLDGAARTLQEGGSGFAVAYLDLDGFKAINDTYGHEAGDEVLRQVARRIRQALGPEDFAARLGGDEFALILAGRNRPHELQSLGRRIIETIEAPIDIGRSEAALVSATLGVALAPSDGTDPLVLLRHADRALYLGKRSGKRQMRFHIGLFDEQLVAAE